MVVPKFAGLIISAPKSLPIKALSPAGSNRSEFGEVGIGLSAPGVALAVERLYMEVLQVVVGRWEHPTLVASNETAVGVPVTRPEMAV